LALTPVQTKKKEIIDLVFARIRKDGFRRISQKEINIWKRKSEKKVDTLSQTMPSPPVIQSILVGFYALPVVLRLVLFILFLISSSTMEGSFFINLLILLAISPIWLGILGYGIQLSTRTMAKVAKGNELGRLRDRLISAVNLVIDLIHSDQELSTYRFSSCGDAFLDWFDIYVEKKASYGSSSVFQQEKYLEAFMNQRIYHYSDQSNQVYFQINCLNDPLYSDQERQKILDKLHKQAAVSVSENHGQNPLNPEVAVTKEEELTPEKREQLVQEAIKELNYMIGLAPVKEFVLEMKDMIAIQVERSKIGQTIANQSLHMIYTGNPGTGKTTVARILAKIFRALGVVSKGHLVEVTREDLVGEVIGHTAPKTRKIIERAIGGILFIDEAYTLSRGGDNDFGKEAIDTLVKGMEENREDLIVILAGYSKEMAEFMKVNSGLKSRFPNQIKFPDYTDLELLQIAKNSLKKEQFMWDQEAEKALHSVLERRQIAGRNDDGNGRLVRNVIQEAVRRQSKRLKQDGFQSPVELRTLKAVDFGMISDGRQFDIEQEFAKVVGNEEIKEHVRALVAQARIQKLRRDQGFSANKGQSLHMIFKGNPGTGKTTFARIIGTALKELGILKSGQLIETDRSGLVATHIGQTAQKVNEMVQEALGGILFIDEAYALASGGESDFGKEAIDTLVKSMEDHRENLVVILAGYSNDMDRFLQTNVGLISRFPTVFEFKDYTAEELYRILLKIVDSQQYQLSEDCNLIIMPILRAHVSSGSSSNGRFVRNLFEKAVRNQSVRLGLKQNIEKDDLLQLYPEDFRK
jgi:stage V sporulation protein K